jgi:hypothetical protein
MLDEGDDAGAPVKKQMPGRRPAHLLNWRQVTKSSLRGFADVQFASGLILREIAVHVAGSRAWASPPSRQWVKDNAVVFDETTGKAKWECLIDFANHGTRASWSRQVIAAVREEHPEALAGAAGADAELPR